MSGLRERFGFLKSGSTPRLSELFAADPDRLANLSLTEQDIYFDFSKTHLTPELIANFVGIAKAMGLDARRDDLFGGRIANPTENRAAEHTAERGEGAPDSVALAKQLHGRMRALIEAIEAGALGDIRHVLHIGIGGSALGPDLLVDALGRDIGRYDVAVVSNVDGAALKEAISGFDPHKTLIVIASKTFTTAETMTNAETALARLAGRRSDCIAITARPDRAAAWGAGHVLPFAESVGGRYSLWSAVGLSLAIRCGPDALSQLRAGAAAMDAHFRDTPLAHNLPVLAALADVWAAHGQGQQTRGVFAYDERLRLLPSYLQQLEMESNGKSVAMDGSPLSAPAGPVVWGEPGTNGQHAFYQLSHQGTRVVPCEFMIARSGHEADLAHQHLLLASNCLAQSEALMRGRSLAEATAIMAKKGLTGAELDRQARHRVFAGNRPSTTLVYPLLTPFVLGQIIALYEHRVFVEGVILGLNSYDQWGVELGKELALALQPILEGKESAAGKDGSTQALVAYLRG